MSAAKFEKEQSPGERSPTILNNTLRVSRMTEVFDVDAVLIDAELLVGEYDALQLRVAASYNLALTARSKARQRVGQTRVMLAEMERLIERLRASQAVI
jgi:hypothetical protein